MLCSSWGTEWRDAEISWTTQDPLLPYSSRALLPTLLQQWGQFKRITVGVFLLSRQMSFSPQLQLSSAQGLPSQLQQLWHSWKCCIWPHSRKDNSLLSTGVGTCWTTLSQVTIVNSSPVCGMLLGNPAVGLSLSPTQHLAPTALQKIKLWANKKKKVKVKVNITHKEQLPPRYTQSNLVFPSNSAANSTSKKKAKLHIPKNLQGQFFSMWELSWEVNLYTNSGLEESQAHPWHNGFEVPLEVKSVMLDEEERFPLSIEGACAHVCILFLILSHYGSHPSPQHILSHWLLRFLASSTFIFFLWHQGQESWLSQGHILGREARGHPKLLPLPGCARVAGSAQPHSWLLPSHHHPFSTTSSPPGASHTSTHDLLFSTISFHPSTFPLLMTTRSSKLIPIRKKQSFFPWPVTRKPFLDFSSILFLTFILFCVKFRFFSQTLHTHANPHIPHIPSILSLYLSAFPRDATNLWTIH